MIEGKEKKAGGPRVTGLDRVIVQHEHPAILISSISMETALSLEAPINLGWGHKIAVFWSITWPSLLVTFGLSIVIPYRYSVDDLEGHLTAFSALANIVFLCGQAILVQRIFRKRYRFFSISAVRDNGLASQKLTVPETMRVWIQIVWPQVVFLGGTFLAISWSRSYLDPQFIRSMTSLGLWVRILVVGPSAIGFAMSAHYPGFRLQAYGYRLI